MSMVLRRLSMEKQGDTVNIETTLIDQITVRRHPSSTVKYFQIP